MANSLLYTHLEVRVVINIDTCIKYNYHSPCVYTRYLHRASRDQMIQISVMVTKLWLVARNPMAN